MIEAGRRSTLTGSVAVLSALVVVALLPSSATAQTAVPVAGQNVNMVSGTGWPGGDPFLQRQNEPSIAVSTRNPAHLLAGANDYRTVDIPGLPGDEVGDAWLGVFKSFDGGQTWQSTLLPGYPQDTSAPGTSSPLKGFKAAADPVIRSGPDGLFYYAGITFNRGTNLGQVFISRFVDQNDRENGNATSAAPADPIRYVDAVVVDTGTSGQFLDKPWIAVDVPRAGAKSCAITGKPTGDVYIAYAKFTGSNTQNSQIFVVKSSDCFKTFSKPIKISPGDHKNQGTTVAIDPATGTAYVAYRRFETNSNNLDAIVLVKSTDGFKSYTSVDAALVEPFDQNPTTATRFRTSSLPALAVSVDEAGVRRVHIAWAERDAPLADARIVVKTSRDGTSWPNPPVKVDAGNDFCQDCYAEGHQFMPSLTFTEGRLVALYYDQRLDQTLGRLKPNYPFGPDGTTGSFYTLRHELLGETAAFGPFVDDFGLTKIRHLLDLRVAQASPSDVPVFASSQVSQYKYGTTPQPVESDLPEELDQLEVNPPNIPMFAKGTLPFIGDYIEVTGLSFVPTASGGWQFNTGKTSAPVHYAVWTSNQDVVPPPDGDWSKYTPPTLDPAIFGTTSYFDGTTRVTCAVNDKGESWAGTRNQNIYFSRITEGLGLWSPQNAKLLNVDRAYVVIAQNSTLIEKKVRLGLPDATTVASFERATLPTSPTTAIWVTIPPLSSIARSVFVRANSDNAARTRVTVEEVEACTDANGVLDCTPRPNGATASLTLNAPGSFGSTLTAPSGGALGTESYAVSISSASVTSPNLASVTSASVTSASVTSASVTSASVTSASVTSQPLAAPQLASVTSASVTSASVTSYNISDASVTSASVTSASVTSASVTSANITDAPISDANYAMKNEGNTTHSYHVKLVGTVPTCTVQGTVQPCPVQLVLSRPYGSPYPVGCTLAQDYRPVSIVNVPDVSGAVVTDPNHVPDPEIPDPDATNATITLGPGETGVITVRGPFTPGQMSTVAQQLVPVVVPHAGGNYASGLLITDDGSGLAGFVVGKPFSAQVQAIGVNGTPYWTATGLPAGLAIDPQTGVVSGTAQAGGPYSPTFKVEVGDQTATKTLSFSVGQGPTTTSLSSSSMSILKGAPVNLTATVGAASAPSAGVADPTGRVSFIDSFGGTQTTLDVDLTGSAADGLATATLSPALAVGTHTFTAAWPGDSNYSASATQAPVTIVVTQITPTVTITGGTFTYDGKSHPATVTVTGLNGTVLASGIDGTLAVTYNGSTTPPVDAGSYTVVATWTSSKPAYTDASASVAGGIVINRAATTTTASASATSVLNGSPVTITATVKAPGAPVAGLPDPTAGVTITDTVNGVATAYPVAFASTAADGQSVASLTLTPSLGTHAFAVSYAGDTNYAASATTVAASVGVTQLTPVITVTGGTFAFDGQPHGASVTVTGQNGASLGTSDGSLAVTYNGLAAPPVNAGGYTVAATWTSANPAYTNASVSVANAVVINRAATTTSLVASPTTIGLGQSVTLKATVAGPTASLQPTGTVTFKDGTTTLGTSQLSSGVATLATTSLAAGSRSITAAYNADANPSNYTTSTSAAATVTVKPPYTFTGFDTPLTTAGTLAAPTSSGSWSYSRVLPVKWKLTDSSNKNVTALSSTKVLAAWWAGATCPATANPPAMPDPVPTDPTKLPAGLVILYSPTSGAAGGSTFRSGGTGFIFNWDATKSPYGAGCYWIRLQLDDLSPEKVTKVLLN
ncbi:MAG: Ig-like domain repeat protein [Vicinamibacteria bacterium]